TLTAAVSDLLRGDPLPSDLTAGDADLGDLDALAGVQQFPTRVKCAALPWATLRLALQRETPSEGPANRSDDGATGVSLGGRDGEPTTTGGPP
ncbi:MAG: hypothetical protein JRI68_31215, partial [Deltaproteobacteria bacterium]|nr:hypothetical protein [Deltaproteobacteria bacterium]